MNHKRLLVILTLIPLLLAAILLFVKPTELMRAFPNTAEKAPSNDLPQPAKAQEEPVPLEALKNPDATKGDKIHDLLSSLNNQRIEFFGRVVDQYGAPVGGAIVTGQVIYNTGTHAGVKRPQATTDSSGKFSFQGLEGRTLDFNITKPGYKFLPEGDAFDYTKLVSSEKQHHPDSDNPILLKMWKLQGPQPLIHKNGIFSLPNDGTPIYIDLKAGRISAEDGDIRLELAHPTQASGAPVKKYDWNATIDSNGGGLFGTAQRISNMCLAPEEGYVGAVRIVMQSSSADWGRIYARSFYLRSRSGLYGRLRIELHTVPTGGSYVSIKSWINPSGSRNLESEADFQRSAR